MISQNQNKLIRSLHLKKFRGQRGLFIIEGIRAIKEALAAKIPLEIVLATEAFSNKNTSLTQLVESNKIGNISPKELNHLSPSASPSGILAVCKIPKFKNPNLDQNFIYLDNVSDPGNMGTILRTASWFGINQVGLSEGCIDPYNPKAVRSAMGAHFHLSWIGHLELSTMNKHTIIGADHRGKSIDSLEKKSENWVLVLGSEAHGLSETVRAALDKTVAIPQIGAGESLNVGVAMGILLFHLTK